MKSKFSFGLLNLALSIAMIFCIFAWWIDRQRLIKESDRKLNEVHIVSSLASRADWLSWHFSDASQETERFSAIRSLILLFEEKEGFKHLEHLDEAYSCELYAAQLLQEIGVTTTNEYFGWADEELNSERMTFPKLGINEYVLPGRETHESSEFRNFIDDAMTLLKPLGGKRLILPGKY